MVLADIFTIGIYQPLFNILVFFYWLLDLVSQQPADMGIAVIMLTLLIRLLLLPLSFAGDDSLADRRRIAEEIEGIETQFPDDPVIRKTLRKKVLRRNRRVVASELISFGIQLTISLVLWRIFSTGLSGKDLHFIYPFMPEVHLPFNLMFLGKIDLAKPSLVLNLLQSLLIFILETLSVLTSPYPSTRAEVIRLQLTLPIVSFIIFLGLPAGKKLFIITALCVSIVLTLFKYIRRRFLEYREKWETKEAASTEEAVMVEVK